MKQLILAMASVGLLGIALAPNAPADEWNKKTIMTVNEPFQVPNMVLPPGKYVIKLLNSPSDRHIVQIFNADEDHLYHDDSGDPELSDSADGQDGIHVLGNASRTTEGSEGVVLPGRQFRPGVRVSEVGRGADRNGSASTGSDHGSDAASRIPQAQVTQTQPEPQQEVAQNTPPPQP